MASGFLLGIVADEVYTEREVQLAPGDAICFYTDGLIEARNEIGELYGTARMTHCMSTIDHTADAATHTAKLLACQQAFSGTALLSDDLTAAFCRVR
jgi:sigma-B regulation protein RsbU (phosphoserine phosphatase)